MMIRALVAAATALAHITLFSASSASAYYSFYDYSNYCNKQQCCWALNVNHWDIRNICYGCEGQDVCNLYTPRTPKPTPRPTKKPTNTNVAWRNDGWNNDGYGDRWSGVQKNYCCQTTGNCPIDTPVVTHRQWLDRAQGVRLKYCCQRSISSWQGDSWGGGGGWRGDSHGRSLQTLLPLCVNTDMPTSSPTLSPTVSQSPSTSPTRTPSETPSSSPSRSSKPSVSSSPSLQPSQSSQPSESPSISLKPSLSSSPSSQPSQSSQPSESPSISLKPSISSSPSSQPSSLPSLQPSLSSQPSVSSSPSSSSKPSVSSQPSESSSPSSQPSAVSNFAGNWGVPFFGAVIKFWLKTSIEEADEGTNIGRVEFACCQNICEELELITFVNENKIVIRYESSVEATLTFSGGTVQLTSGTFGPFTGTAIDPFLCSPSASPSASP